MDNKDKAILEMRFKSSYEGANRYIAQNNLDGALDCLKRALENAIQLAKITVSAERDGYMIKVKNITDAIKLIQSKQQPAAGTNKPGASAKPQEKKQENTEPLPKLSVEESLAKLDELIGLGAVKNEVRDLINYLKVQQMNKEFGLPTGDQNNHLIFAGSPGTGKTTVARIIADILYSLGIIEKGQLVEVQREDLVAGYVGQTGIKTQEKVEEAMGGVLFIDEIYRLAEGGENDFGKEAVGVLLKAVEDRRGEFVTVLAGYENRMDDFIRMNPGLKSRFPNTLHFDDYTVDEMVAIFKLNCRKGGKVLSEPAERILRTRLQKMYDTRDENFGNARDVRNLFEKTCRKQANRIAGVSSITKDALMTLLPEDIA
ncbi:MAG: AAA family ATPase [Clostridia bacterium]|nr:AAA family ATPase [Clostridia bacterium]